ncbi:kinase-like domain-containing protein [Thamnidium elegans]|nr:kinase-like domain-containing protein [Thamnidium elegans]
MSPPDNSFVLSNNTSPQINQHMMIDGYLLGESVGFGGFSIVRKAHHQTTGTLVAVKIINQHLMTATDKMRLERELTIWKSLHHPRITQLYKIIKTDQTCFILCDYCSEGNLLSFLNTVKKLEEEQAKKIFKEICQGVYYLHVDVKVCHKDLKLENILLSDQGHVKICDFGLAIYQNHHRYADEWVGGSLAYASPEQIKQPNPLTCPKTDIWSLGVILYALVVGALPFTDTYDLRLQQKILDAQYDVPMHLSSHLQQLIRSCLAHDTDKRCTIDQVLNSKWLKE